MKHILPRLDIMIAYSCNLACKGCISLSDFPRAGVEEFLSIQDWIDQWKSCISPKVVAVFGGEPCLHPKLIEICQHIRLAWPNSTIRLITNGYLLKKIDPSVWFDLGNFEMQISVHRKDHESLINQEIKRILLQRSDWKITQHGGQQHKQLEWHSQQVRIYKSAFKDFVVPYRQENNKLLPWHSNATAAHKICGSPAAPILYKGLLYKCPAVANIIDLTQSNWFGYQACAVDGDIDTFISNIGKPEFVCSQCPDQQQAVVVDHFDKKNVVVKQKNIS
jgi:organic radical activating enzyme